MLGIRGFRVLEAFIIWNISIDCQLSFWNSSKLQTFEYHTHRINFIREKLIEE